jgi:hypothetical protein
MVLRKPPPASVIFFVDWCVWLTFPGFTTTADELGLAPGF